MKPGAEKTPVSVDKIECKGEGPFEDACNVTYASKSKCKVHQCTVNGIASLCGSVGKDFVYHSCGQVPTKEKLF